MAATKTAVAPKSAATDMPEGWAKIIKKLAALGATNPDSAVTKDPLVKSGCQATGYDPIEEAGYITFIKVEGSNSWHMHLTAKGRGMALKLKK